jgi:hypothetical protein
LIGIALSYPRRYIEDLLKEVLYLEF